jgi:regulator of protease activity HflC (stomatin/prohibitin superfamily)
MARANGKAPAQTLEGLSVGLELSVRWAIDADKLDQAKSKGLPDNPDTDIIEPAVQGVVYRILAGHTVREIFSTRRAEIQQEIEAELRGKLAAEGLVLRAVQIGNVDLPTDYRRGLDSLLAEGLATEKMRYTLELKDKRVKETELDAAADKVRREIAAEAAGREQVIAARAQEEAMKHVLPFKQRQVEQRQLEAEAERVARVKMAEGNAQARRIEAVGEADARQKLADAEAYRMARLGKISADQMAVEGVLISRHPLLIQKALADRLSDKIQVIIAPTPNAGGFIGNALVGALQATKADAPHEAAEQAPTSTQAE